MSTPKFGRNYVLGVETIEGTVLNVRLPFTIEFDINRNILSNASDATVRVYNLSRTHRNSLRRDILDWADLRTLTLYAGYGSDTSKLPIVFVGNVTRCYSVREGSNFITEFTCLDGGWAFTNALTNASFPANTPQQYVVESLVNDLKPTITPGAIGSYGGTNGRGSAYSGNTCDILSEVTGGGFFIDNAKAFCLNQTEVLQGSLPLINSSVGLLNQPIAEENILHFDMVFEPRLIVGQRVTLDSPTSDFPKGDYKVVAIQHRGMISDAVCGDSVTTVGLWYTPRSLRTVPFL